MEDAKRFGGRSEDEAAKYLAGLGYKVLERNFRTKVGEIDLIAKEGGTLVFVEVKSLRSTGFGTPELKVDWHKRRQIARAAMMYLTRKRLGDVPCRFDVVALSKGADTEYKFQLFRDAFELDGGY